jgi:HAD superfamily hydrolase (TIGR01490 family)
LFAFEKTRSERAFVERGDESVGRKRLKLALFDLDNTLLNGDSDFEWSRFLVEQGVLERELFEAKNLAFYEQYKAGTLDIQEFLDFQLQPLSRHSRKVLDAWHEDFMRIKVRPMMGDAARALVAKHRDAGDICVIITATNSFVTAPIAREFGVPHLIGTDPEQINGEFTGRVAGVPSFREGKITRLESWMAERGWGWASFADTTFYSDSLNDLPLLAKVKKPVAVDPDATLRAHAQQQGWPVISLRP